MALMIPKTDEQKAVEPPSRPVQVIQQIARPLFAAQRKFYLDQPQAFLEFVLTAIFVVGSLIVHKTGLYLALVVWIIFYFKGPRQLFETYKKIKKKGK